MSPPAEDLDIPSDSELFKPVEGPGRFQSCFVCRARKTRCDGLRPSCSYCTGQGRACDYPAKRVKPRRPRLEQMEAKIEALQAQIRALGANPQSTPAAEIAPKTLRTPPKQKAQPVVHSTPRKRLLAHALFINWSQEQNQAITPQVPSNMLPFFPQPIWLDSTKDVGRIKLREPYMSVIPRETIECALARWKPELSEDDIPIDLSEYLIRIFLPFRAHLTFHTNLDIFFDALRLPSSAPPSEKVHPALLNAIYLIACSLGGGYMSRFEPIFLKRVQAQLHCSLAMADRMGQTMWAQLLLGSYFARMGRVLEAHTTISAVIRFAIGCGICPTALDDDEERLKRMTAGQSRLETAMMKKETLRSVIFTVNRITTSFSDLPSAMPESAIPRFADLSYDLRYDSDVLIRQKIQLLVEESLALSSALEGGVCPNMETLLESATSIESAFSQADASLPSLASFTSEDPSSTPVDMCLTPEERMKPGTVPPLLFWMRCMLMSVEITIHSIRLSFNTRTGMSLEDPENRDIWSRRLAVAMAMAHVMNQMREGSTTVKGRLGIHPIFGGVCFQSHGFLAAQVLVKELLRVSAIDPTNTSNLSSFHSPSATLSGASSPSSQRSSTSPRSTASSLVSAPSSATTASSVSPSLPHAKPSSLHNSTFHTATISTVKNVESTAGLLFEFLSDLAGTCSAWYHGVEDLHTLLEASGPLI